MESYKNDNDNNNKNTDTQEEFNEMVLIEDYTQESKDNEKSNLNEEGESEFITDEEFLLDCCRFGDTEDLNNLFNENPNININYTDSRKNNALRIINF